MGLGWRFGVVVAAGLVLPLAAQTAPRTDPAEALPPLPPGTILPDPAWAAHDLEVGVFYYDQGDYTGALARFVEAYELDPRTTEALYRKGLAEVKLDRPAEARAALEAYLKADPEGKFAAAAKKELGKLAPRKS